MRKLFLGLFVFLAITGAVFLASQYSIAEFADLNYWDKHGILFLIFIAAFPRLTLLLSSVATGGLIWWLGWLFAPRVLVAVLATLTYWHKNPVLVVISWVIAIGGESTEKTVVVRNQPFRRQTQMRDVTPIQKD